MSETSTPEERAEEFTSAEMALIDVGLQEPRKAIYELYLQMERVADAHKKELEKANAERDDIRRQFEKAYRRHK